MPSTSNTTFTAPWFPGVFNPALSQYQQFQATGPTISNIWQNMPLEAVPGMDPTQQNLLDQLVQTSQNNPQTQEQLAMLQEVAGGPIGSSPLTKAGIQNFIQNELPVIQQQAALRGTAGGGQAIEATGQGYQSAIIPFYQQEIANKEAAIGQLGQVAQQKIQQLALAFEASGVPREIALEQAQAKYQQEEQKSKLALGLQTMPLQFLGPLGIASRTSTPSNVWGDVIGALGPAIAALLAA